MLSKKYKMKKKSLFNIPVKNRSLSRKISITSPTAFKRSIRELKKGGINIKEKRALVLARNRAKAQLNRKNLSPKERKQFREISKINLPKINR